MKKFLLTLACAFAVIAASAAEVTFTFCDASKVLNSYGLPEYNASNSNSTQYANDGSVITQDAVTITFNAKDSNGAASNTGWRMWSDGLRAYYKQNPTFTVAVNGGTITNITWAGSGTSFVDAANTDTAITEWTGNAASVTLKYTATANKALTSITVTYTGGEAPVIDAPKVSCEDNKVTITAEDADAIYYTLDGTEPTNASTKYTAPFAITQNVTVKAIAYKGTDKSLVTTFNAIYYGNYPDFAAFIAANTTGTVDGPLSVLYQSADKRYLYLKDKNGGYMLSFGDLPDAYVNGDILASITGKYSPYNQLPEMVPTAAGAKTTGAAVDPEELTIEELSVDMANTYVVLKNVTISSVSNKNFSITDETGTVAGYNTLALAEIPEGEGFTLIGFVSRYNNNLQITPVSIEGGVVIETVETPAFSVAAGAVKAGTEVAITCATPGAVIFYTTDGTAPTAASTEYEAPIAINAAVEIKAIAIKEGMNDSPVASAAYTILDENASDALFDFVNNNLGITEPSTVSTGTDIAGQTFTQNAVTLAFAENTNTNVARLWKATGGLQLRVYTTDSFTISVPSGYGITSIEFAGPSGKLTLKTTVGTYTIGNPATTALWTPETLAQAEGYITSVPFTVTANAQINNFKVIYEKDKTGVVDAIEADLNAPVEYYTLQGVRVANPTNGLYIKKQGNAVSKVLVK